MSKTHWKIIISTVVTVVILVFGPTVYYDAFHLLWHQGQEGSFYGPSLHTEACKAPYFHTVILLVSWVGIMVFVWFDYRG